MTNFTAQKLYLQPHEDEKLWVAEITGPDPTFKLKRNFLPQIAPNEFAIYDGYYQLHGIHPGITPFTKEYCIVQDGKMQRGLRAGHMLEQLPAIQAMQPLRVERLRFQIRKLLDEIADEVQHERVAEDILYQKEELGLVEDIDQLYGALATLIRQKDRMIQTYRARLGLI